MATKSIEERAAERYENPQEPYCFETDREQQWYRCGECDGYIAGATEQDRIARQEERERCIKELVSMHVLLCPDGATANELRKRLEGSEG